jgi:hypothetical protein
MTLKRMCQTSFRTNRIGLFDCVVSPFTNGCCAKAKRCCEREYSSSRVVQQEEVFPGVWRYCGCLPVLEYSSTRSTLLLLRLSIRWVFLGNCGCEIRPSLPHTVQEWGAARPARTTPSCPSTRAERGCCRPIWQVLLLLLDGRQGKRGGRLLLVVACSSLGSAAGGSQRDDVPCGCSIRPTRRPSRCALPRSPLLLLLVQAQNQVSIGCNNPLNRAKITDFDDTTHITIKPTLHAQKNMGVPSVKIEVRRVRLIPTIA